MEVVPFLVLSLLLTGVSALRGVPHSSCSSKLYEDQQQQQLNSSGVHLILHHPLSPCSPASLPRDLPFSDILDLDESRAQALAARLTNSTSSKSSPPKSFDQLSIGSPLNPGTSVGVGNYVTKIGLGSPAVDYVMVADTGSSLTWLQCLPCQVYCHRQEGSIFNPSTSMSYASIACSASECNELKAATLNPSRCSPTNVCIYTASYGDGSFSLGYLSRDMLSVGSRPVLPGFVYGCGQNNQGLFGRSAGLIGLDRNKLSMLSQLAPKFGNAFSYCLPSTASSGYLSIGSYNPSQFAFTPMLSSGSSDTSLYSLRLTEITVNRGPLAVAPSAYAALPTIIDSGTVITRLPTAVYAALSKAVVAALSKYPRAPAVSILDTCFKGSLNKLAVPQVSMVFQGGATLRLQAKNVMIDVSSKTTCLAFASASQAAIIGNKQQQTFKVVYDVAKAKIGFAAGGCG